MKPLATAIIVTGFTALFLAYAMGVPTERPTGVRRALQTIAGEFSTIILMTRSRTNFVRRCTQATPCFGPVAA